MEREIAKIMMFFDICWLGADLLEAWPLQNWPEPRSGRRENIPYLSIDGLLVTKTTQETPRRPPEMRLENQRVLSKKHEKQQFL